MAYNRLAAANDNQFNKDSRKIYYLLRNDLSDIEKYRELKKVMIGKGEDYTTGSLLDYNYFKKHYKLVAYKSEKHYKSESNSTN